MFEVTDYSSHRGGLVTLLPKIYAVLSENAAKDTLAAFTPPANIILWKQQMRKMVVDINRRFVMVTDAQSVAGFMFYHFEGGAVYLDELQAAWPYRKNPAVINMLLDKFVNNREVKAAGAVFAGENIKAPLNKELLASVGFTDEFPGGWEPLGGVTDAVGELKLRYLP